MAGGLCIYQPHGFNTGVRVQELIDLRANDLQLSNRSVFASWKGRKERICPIWPDTAHLLSQLSKSGGIDPREPGGRFTNHADKPHPLLRYSIPTCKALHHAATVQPSLEKRLHPHSMRQSTAIHLLKAGVDSAQLPIGWGKAA